MQPQFNRLSPAKKIIWIIFICWLLLAMAHIVINMFFMAGGVLSFALIAGALTISALAGIFITLLLAGISFLLYFLPSLIAVKRNHRNQVAILVLNLFAGWTLIGWIVALVWAFTN